MKHTLQSKFLHLVSPHLSDDGTLPPSSYKYCLSNLHTSAVNHSILSLSNNRVLNAPAPQIDPSESSLPRPYRSTLSQLRSGFCSKLQSYLHLINVAPSPLCPHCSTHPETTSHLFNCPTLPTHLTTSHLWSSPLEVAHFISTHPSFSLLLPLPRPPPEPPLAPTQDQR